MTSKSVLHLVNETNWGELPGSPTYVYCPCENYGVDDQAETRQLQTYAGVSQGVDNEILRSHPAGQLQAKWYGWKPAGTVSLAQLLFEWGFGDIGSRARRSKSAEWADGFNQWNVRDLGLRCDKATISGTEDAADLMFSLDLIGRQRIGQGDEVADPDNVESDPLPTAQVPPTNRRKLATGVFHHVSLTFGDLGGSETAIAMQKFQLTSDRMLKPHWLNAQDANGHPVLGSLNSPPQDKFNFNFTPQKTNGNFDAFRRLAGRHEYQATLVIKALHQGTGATGDWTVLSLALGRMSLVNAPTTDSREDDPFQERQFMLLKPEGAANAIVPTWSEE